MSLKRVKNESKAQSNETARGPEPEKTYSIFFLHPEVNQMEIFFFSVPSYSHTWNEGFALGWKIFFFFLIVKIRQNSFFPPPNLEFR